MSQKRSKGKEELNVYMLPLSGMEELGPGVWLCPASREKAAFVGSIKSNKFHRLDCYHTNRIHQRNRICFLDHDAAKTYGRVECSVCSLPKSEGD